MLAVGSAFRDLSAVLDHEFLVDEAGLEHLRHLGERRLHLRLDVAVHEIARRILQPAAGVGAESFEESVQIGESRAEQVLYHPEPEGVVLSVSVRVVVDERLGELHQFVDGRGRFHVQRLEPVRADPQELAVVHVAVDQGQRVQLAVDRGLGNGNLVVQFLHLPGQRRGVGLEQGSDIHRHSGVHQQLELNGVGRDHVGQVVGRYREAELFIVLGAGNRPQQLDLDAQVIAISPGPHVVFHHVGLLVQRVLDEGTEREHRGDRYRRVVLRPDVIRRLHGGG